MNGERDPEAGVSLLELTISLLVLAMIGVGVTALLSTGTRVLERSERMEVVVEEALARTRVRRAIENMPTPNAHLKGPELFGGDEAGFWFRLPEEDTLLAGATPYVLRVRLQQNENDTGILVTVLSEDEVTLETRVLAENAVDVRIQYFGNKAPREDESWYTEWQDAVLLPKLVKLEATLTSGRDYAPFAVQPAKMTRQRVISLSSLVPPD